MGLKEEKISELQFLNKEKLFLIFSVEELGVINEQILTSDDKNVKMSILFSKHGKFYANRFIHDKNKDVATTAREVLSGTVEPKKNAHKSISLWVRKRRIQKLLKSLLNSIYDEEISLASFIRSRNKIKLEVATYMELKLRGFIKEISKKTGHNFFEVIKKEIS